jgi:hypothetical protein
VFAPGFVSGWRTFSTVSLCKLYLQRSAVACLPVALADLCGCVWGLSRVSVSCVACVCLCLASARCLSAPMLLGVSLVPLCNTSLINRENGRKGPPAGTKARCNRTNMHKARLRNARQAEPKHPNPHTGRKTGLNNLSRGPGEQPRARRDRASGSGQQHASQRTRPTDKGTRCPGKGQR